MNRTWCECCDMERAEYVTEQREQRSAWATLVYCQRVCLPCLRAKIDSIGHGKLWGMRYRSIIGNAWNVEGDF